MLQSLYSMMRERKKVYSFEPVPEDSLTVDQQKYVIGGQGNVWTEFIGTPEYAEYMFLPRMCALAEVLWTPKDKRDWSSFKKHMDKQYRRLYAMGADFRIPCPVIDRAVVVNKGEAVKIGNPLSIGEIRYSIGEKDPDDRVEKAFRDMTDDREISIIFITEEVNARILKQIKNFAMEKGLYPLVITLPSEKKDDLDRDHIKNLIKRAVGMDLEQ